MKVVEFAETPNPNAIKCVLDAKVSDKARSYFNAAAAEADPLASALFAIPGVTNVLILGDFVTVSKAPASAWAPIRKGIRKVIEGTAS